jgi:two-component system, sensor histidine kinase
MPTRTDLSTDILMVDDREDGLIALEALLGDNPNYRLVKAGSGIEAIALLDQYDFAMILLDVQMPHMDGFQTAEYMRRNPRHRNIPIIFVTAINNDDRYIYRGYEAGAVDYVFKPFDPVILKSKVAVFTELHVKNRQIRSQQKQLAERELLEHRAAMQAHEIDSLRRYQNLAESIPHIIVRSAPDGTMEYHNENWSTYTGMAPGEALGNGWQAALHPEDLPKSLIDWSTAIRTKSKYENESRIRRRDGVYRWHWIKAEPEIDDHGNVIAWLGTITDIEDRKTFEDKLKEAQRTAELANEAKTHFLANMSHEIRTPLNAIMGFTELLTDPAHSMEEKMKNVAVVRRNCHQLLKIVNEILDISKVEAGELETEKVETHISELLGEVKALLRVQASKKGIDLKFEPPIGVPARVMTDSTRLRQILLNIVGNALKFTTKGSVTVSTKFSTTMNGRSYVYFTVTDTGVGIDQQNSQKIFQPFSQADTSTTRLFGGTGLGLALARRLARALGGDVELLTSEPNKGSSFLVSIEVDVLDQAEWAQLDKTAEEKPHVELADASALKGKRILLVEDAEDNQFLIQQFLSRTGAIVEIANNGNEGVDKALKNDYEVVLMDIQMPFKDGYQATSELRSKNYNKPIIALTAHALVEEREKCLRAGCTSHLTKPINRQQLIESLVSVI